MVEYIFIYFATVISLSIFNIFMDISKSKAILTLIVSFIITAFIFLTERYFHVNLFLSCLIIYLFFMLRLKYNILSILNIIIIVFIVNCIYTTLGLPLNKIFNYRLHSIIIYILIYAIIAICLMTFNFNININNISYLLSKSTKKQIIKFKIYFAIILLSIISFYGFVSYIKLFPYQYSYEIYRILLYIAFFVFSFFILLIIILFDLLQLSMTSTLDSIYKTEINDFFKVIRSQRHDYSFHLQAVYGLLSQGQYDKCLKYVEAIVTDTQKISELIPISEIAISSMIMSFKQKAEHLDIKLNISVEYNLDNICCSVYEINRIIGNLLQNAIDESALHKENKLINLFILKRMGMGIIRVENPITEMHISKEDMYKIGITSKDKKIHEGIGLSTVKSITEKYNGKLHIDFDENMIIISAYMPLK